MIKITTVLSIFTLSNAISMNILPPETQSTADTNNKES